MEKKNENFDENENKNDANDNENSFELIPTTKLLITKNLNNLRKNPDENIIIIPPKNENKNIFMNNANNMGKSYQNIINNNFNLNQFNNNNHNKNNNDSNKDEINTKIVLKTLNRNQINNFNNNIQNQNLNLKNYNNNIQKMNYNSNNLANNNYNNNYNAVNINNNNFNNNNYDNNNNFNNNNLNRINPNMFANNANISNNYINNINNINNNMNNNMSNNMNNNMSNNININNNYLNFGNNLNNNMPNYNNQISLSNPINNFQNQNMINNNNYFNSPMNNNNNFMNNVNFNNNMNNYNNQILNNVNQMNFNNNNQINCFFNMQLPYNNNINNNFNFNMYNNGMFNFNNIYFLQCMQKMLFQQVFFKYLHQQYLFQYFMSQKNNFQFQNGPQPQPPMPQIENEFSQNNDLYQDLLDILREPNIKAKDDAEIFEQYSQPELMSNDLTTEIITEFLNLDPELLNGFGNKFKNNWAKGEQRGGMPYHPPLGWIGFGLNVINKYDYGNNDWLACDGRIGEWCVGYHGIGRNQSSDEVRNMILSILKNNLQPGQAQACKNQLDINHRPNRVGIGVYCSPKQNVLEDYAGYIVIRNKKYKVGIMVRCKQDKIRIPQGHKDYWVLDGSFEQLRPYRLLIKRVNNYN